MSSRLAPALALAVLPVGWLVREAAGESGAAGALAMLPLLVLIARALPRPRVPLLALAFAGCFAASHLIARATPGAWIGIGVAAVLLAAAVTALARR